MLKGGGATCLRTSVEELIARFGSGEGRPLLRGDPAEIVPKLLSERAPAYESAAELDRRHRRSENEPDDVAGEIVEQLG